MISKKKIKEALIKISEGFDTTAQNTILKLNLQKHVNEIFHILKLTEKKDRANILDIGGGMGVNLLAISYLGFPNKLYLLERFDEYMEGTSMGQYNQAIKDLFNKYKINVINQDIINDKLIPYPDNTFDIITIFDVVEHFPKHPLEVLKEIRRTLVTDGFLILKAPNLFGLFEVIKFFIGRHPYMKFNVWIQDYYFSHYREYTKKEYCKLIAITDFKIIKSFRTSEAFITPATCELSIKSFLNMIFLLLTTVFYFFRPTVCVIGQKGIRPDVNL